MKKRKIKEEKEKKSDATGLRPSASLDRFFFWRGEGGGNFLFFQPCKASWTLFLPLENLLALIILLQVIGNGTIGCLILSDNKFECFQVSKVIYPYKTSWPLFSP